MSGYSIKDLEDSGIGARDLIRVALDPKGYQGLTQYWQEAAPYYDFDQEFTYNKANESNQVKLRYLMTNNPGIKSFANDFWDEVAAAGYDWQSAAGNMLDPSKQQEIAEKYGIDPETFSTLTAQMQADVPEFLTAEVNRQKSQYSEFLKNKKKMGADSQTGKLLSALAKAPKSGEEFTGNRLAALKKMTEGKGDFFAQAAEKKAREVLKSVTSRKEFNPVLAYLPFINEKGL
jgi:hypothetical protein